jgi:hypothetical protein
LRFKIANVLNRSGGCQSSKGLSNRLRGCRIAQTIVDKLFLPSELLSDQFPRNSQGGAGLMGEGLGAAEAGIGRADRPSCYKY